MKFSNENIYFYTMSTPNKYYLITALLCVLLSCKKTEAVEII